MNKVIYVIIGSTRPKRIGPQIADWLVAEISPILAKDGVDIEIVDLATVDLPLFNEPQNPKTGIYTHDYTKAWSAKISQASGYIFVTPEYNHSYPASVKNAIDYLFKEWNDKPMAFVAYGWGGGKLATEHLKVVAGGIKAKVMQNNLSIYLTPEILDDQQMLKDPKVSLQSYNGAAQELAKEIAKNI